MDDVDTIFVSDEDSCIERTVSLVAAYVSNNSLPASELPALLSKVYGAIGGLSSPVASAEPTPNRLTPAQIKKSITHNALVSFEDGKSYKTLKRHLTKLGLTPELYREKWGLPRDYPMVTASYSEARSVLAKSVGLGQQRRSAHPKAADVAEAPKIRRRK